MLIKKGTIIDGSGSKEKYQADLRIEGSKIINIGNLRERSNEEIIDAENCIVSPGFVDILNHSDAFITIFDNPAQENLLRQGITTALMGNCGSSLAPLVDGVFVNSIQKWGNPQKINVNWNSLEEYLQELEQHSFGINLATLAGHSTIRRAFAGDEHRILTDVETKKMLLMMERALEEGAFGVSLGLGYAHGRPADRNELEKIAELVSKYNALYSCHIRNESDSFKSAANEQLEVAEKSSVNMQLSHLKVAGKNYWHEYEDVIGAISGKYNVNFDLYPYSITASVLYRFLPAWVAEEGNKSIFKYLRNEKHQKRIVEEMQESPYSIGDMIVAMGDIDNTYSGKTLKEIASNQEKSPEQIAIELILASENRIIVFTPNLSEENVEEGIRHSDSFVSSDSVGIKPKSQLKDMSVHPRYFGAMPKFLREYVKEKELLGWEDAIAKITGKPAEKIKLKNRGIIKEGNYADLVIFSPDTLQDKANFENPYQYPEGIKHVIVNGKIAVRNEEIKNMAGQVLKRT